MLHGLCTMLPGADANGVLDADDENLPVSHLTLAGAPGDGKLVDDGRHDLGFHHRLDLEPRPERDVHRGAAVLLGVAALGATSLDLRHRDPRNAALVQHVLDL